MSYVFDEWPERASLSGGSAFGQKIGPLIVSPICDRLSEARVKMSRFESYRRVPLLALHAVNDVTTYGEQARKGGRLAYAYASRAREVTVVRSKKMAQDAVGIGPFRVSTYTALKKIAGGTVSAIKEKQHIQAGGSDACSRTQPLPQV